MGVNNEKPLNVWVDDRLASLCPDETWQPNVDVGLARLKAMSTSGGRFNRRWIWTAVVGAAICLSLGILQSPRGLAHKCVECSLAVWKTFASVGSAQTNVQPKNSRKMAPEFGLKDANGNEVRLSKLKGKVVLVNFWATWCEGCQVEIPWFIEFEKKHGESGLVVIGVSMDDDGWKSIKPWVKEKRVNYPIVIGDQNLATQYGLKAMPLTVLVDRDGRIANVHEGIVNKTDTEKSIRTLLGEIDKSNSL